MTSLLESVTCGEWSAIKRITGGLGPGEFLDLLVETDVEDLSAEMWAALAYLALTRQEDLAA